MRREFRERFPRHRLQRKPLVSDPSMHHDTCITHVPLCMPGSLTRCCGKTFPAFPVHAQPAILRIWEEAIVVNVRFSTIAPRSLHYWTTPASSVKGSAMPQTGTRKTRLESWRESHFNFIPHWGQDNTAAIFQISFPLYFVFWLKFHWKIFPMLQLTICQQWLIDRWQSIICSNIDAYTYTIYMYYI